MSDQDEVWVFDPTTSLDQAPNDKTSPPLKLGSTIQSIGWAPAISRTPRSSQVSEDLTSASSEPDGAPSASPRSTPTPLPSSQSDGPESPTSETSPTSQKTSDGDEQGNYSGMQPWVVHSEGGNVNSRHAYPAERAISLTTWGSFAPSQGGTIVGTPPPSGPAASPAKTSPSLVSGKGSGSNIPSIPTTTQTTGASTPDRAWPSPSLTLWSATDLPPSSSKTYRDSSPVMEARILGRSSVAWGNSGTGGPTGFSTLSSSECPSDDDGCSFVPSTLAQVLEPTAPQRFYLSARAASGIIRRASRRGRELPKPLFEALTGLAAQTSPEASPSEDTSASSPTDRTPTPANSSPEPSSPDRSATTTTPSRTTSSAASKPETPSPSMPKEQPTANSSLAPFDSTPGQAMEATPSSSVRRLTPVECERLMGWPDGWTIARGWRTR